MLSCLKPESSNESCSDVCCSNVRGSGQKVQSIILIVPCLGKVDFQFFTGLEDIIDATLLTLEVVVKMVANRSMQSKRYRGVRAGRSRKDRAVHSHWYHPLC